ncbi:MAG: hypothetical protein WD512_13770 [Candidatus Paceibacterota bacterium]
MGKKVYQLHDKFTEEILESVIIDAEDQDKLWEEWEKWHYLNNSESEEDPDIDDFIHIAKQNGLDVETIEVDFIQL